MKMVETNKEFIKKLGKLQCEIMVLTVLVSNFPIAYTNNNLGEMFRDLELKDRLYNCIKEFKIIVSDKDLVEVTNYTKDNPDSVFKEEEQSLLIKELTGKKESLDQFLERYK